MKNDIRIKRVGAYLLDMVLVTLIVMILSYVDLLNPTLEQYNSTYTTYSEKYDQYQNEEISEDEYKEAYYQYNYDVARYGACYTIINLVVVIGYFVIFQYFNHGQTLGKKILSIKVVGYNDKKLNIGNYLVRALILNGLFFNVVALIAVWFTNITAYYNISYWCYQINYLLEVVIICMIFMDKDNRGLHDKLAGTVVIDLKKSPEEVLAKVDSKQDAKEVVDNVEVIKTKKVTKKVTKKSPKKEGK